MKLAFVEKNSAIALIRINALHDLGIMALHKYDRVYKQYKIYQTNKLHRLIEG